MYNEVERFHNRKEAENYLALEDDGAAGDESSEDDGLTKNREGVFDLGVAGSSAEEDDDESDDDEEEEERAAASATKRRAAAIAEGFESSSDDSSESDEDGDPRSKLLNWGDNKQSYYHGDTADLEIGQDVEDAYLEEAAGREVEQARLEGMDDADFMLDGDDDEHDTGAPAAEPTHKKRRKAQDDAMETIQAARRSKPLSTLSKKDKVKLLKAHHPELLPLVRHFSSPIRDLSDTTLVAAGALLKDDVAKGAREAEVRVISRAHPMRFCRNKHSI